jgi:hypothetical protein
MPGLIALRASPAAASRTGLSAWRVVPRAERLSIEQRSLPACAAIEAEWRDLAARAIEPNLFFAPDFALPAAQHLVAFRDASVQLVWAGEPGQGRLLGLLPASWRRPLLGPHELAGWTDPRLGNAAPLVDAERAGEVIASLRAAPGARRRQTGGRLRFAGLDLDGPFASALQRAAGPLGWSVALKAAPVRSPAAGAPALAALRRGLSCHGQVAIARSGCREELRDMVELILALEASGPAARRGEAALQDVREAAFLRSMTRGLARSQQCRAALMLLDGEPIAGAILLGKAPRLWLQASAQAERYASFAPLAQLLASLARRGRGCEIIGQVPGPHEAARPLRIGEIRLEPRAPRRPLAGRARIFAPA